MATDEELTNLTDPKLDEDHGMVNHAFGENGGDGTPVLDHHQASTFPHHTPIIIEAYHGQDNDDSEEELEEIERGREKSRDLNDNLENLNHEINIPSSVKVCLHRVRMRFRGRSGRLVREYYLRPSPVD
jgi:hypothetical protein